MEWPASETQSRSRSRQDRSRSRERPQPAGSSTGAVTQWQRTLPPAEPREDEDAGLGSNEGIVGYTHEEVRVIAIDSQEQQGEPTAAPRYRTYTAADRLAELMRRRAWLIATLARVDNQIAVLMRGMPVRHHPRAPLRGFSLQS